MSLPNYSHRTFPSGKAAHEQFDESNLIDSIGLLVIQAESVISQMQTQFISEAVGTLSAETNFNTLDSIRNELLDIQVLVNWYFDKKRGDANER